jgi:hypothetical protein
LKRKNPDCLLSCFGQFLQGKLIYERLKNVTVMKKIVRNSRAWDVDALAVWE